MHNFFSLSNVPVVFFGGVGGRWGVGGGEDMHDSSEDWREWSSLRLKYPGPFFLACNFLSTSDVPVVFLFCFFGGGKAGEDMHDSSEDWREWIRLRLKYPGSFSSAHHNLLPHNINCTVISFNLKTVGIMCLRHHSAAECQLVPSMTILCLHPNQYPVDTQSTLGQHSVNSQLNVDQLRCIS